MPRSGRSQDQINNLVHRQYTAWATGDGATTEFAVPKKVLRLDDIQVTINGAVMRPSASGVAFDYAVRGLTPGYVGDQNMVKFTVAPANGTNIGFFLNAD